MAKGPTIGAPVAIRQVRLVPTVGVCEWYPPPWRCTRSGLNFSSRLFVVFHGVVLQLAGLVAKGNIAGVMETITPHTLHLTQVMLLAGLVDPEPVIRSTSNNIVCTIARWTAALEGWLDLFPFLVSMLESGDAGCVVSGAVCGGGHLSSGRTVRECVVPFRPRASVCTPLCLVKCIVCLIITPCRSLLCSCWVCSLHRLTIRSSIRSFFFIARWGPRSQGH
jgi:hypothetical protein